MFISLRNKWKSFTYLHILLLIPIVQLQNVTRCRYVYSQNLPPSSATCWKKTDFLITIHQNVQMYANRITIESNPESWAGFDLDLGVESLKSEWYSDLWDMDNIRCEIWTMVDFGFLDSNLLKTAFELCGRAVFGIGFVEHDWWFENSSLIHTHERPVVNVLFIPICLVRSLLFGSRDESMF